MTKQEQLAIKLTQIYFESLPRATDTGNERMTKIIDAYIYALEQVQLRGL